MARPVQDPGIDTLALILEHAIPLFANAGFSGVSMREIATAVGITPAALYHHFADKETLYLEAMRQAFAGQATSFTEALRAKGSPERRLELFVTKLAEHMYAEPSFLRLMQRERLDGDERRLRQLAEYVFRDQFEAMAELATELAPQYDPHLLAISIAGLVMYHIEIAPLRHFLPGGLPQHDDPAVIAKHVVRLILSGTAMPR